MHDHAHGLPLVAGAGGDGFRLRGFHHWDPRVKLGLLAGAVALNVVVAVAPLSFGLFAVAGVVALWSRVSLRHLGLFFLAPAWATLIIALGFSVGFGSTPAATLGPVTFYREGIAQGLSAALRVASDMAWMGVVFLTTPFSQVLDALRWFRVPGLLVDTLALAYRYAFLLREQYARLRDASKAKGGFRDFRSRTGTGAMILAKVLIRAYDRAVAVQEAMVARGSASTPTAPTRPVASEGECPNECDVTPLHDGVRGGVLRCADLHYLHGGSSGRGVRGIDLEVGRGEAVAVCGPNGAGKTTLLKLISGILPPQGGEIWLGAERLDRRTRNEAFRRVGILFQDPQDQLFCTHVREDVAYGPKNLGLPEAEVDRLVDTSMALLEVDHLAHRPTHSLSHGEMKRVGLAGLIALRPPLLLLDEPTANLDPASARHLVGLIRHLNRHHGYSFLVVTHAVDIAPMIASRMVVLDDGEIAADGPVRSVLSDARLLERCRLEPPTLTKLFWRLSEDGTAPGEVPITIEEAVRALKQTTAPEVQGSRNTRKDVAS